MKPLHRSAWRTESDCGVQVDVAEGRTTEWVPFREIVVTTDAGMTPAEARRLIADLQHAVALAEEFDAPEREDVSTDDQPKPRVWHKGDAEPPADVKLLQATNGDQLMRFLDSRWGWLVLGGISRFYNANTLRPWHRVDWADHTQLSEVDFPAASEAKS